MTRYTRRSILTAATAATVSAVAGCTAPVAEEGDLEDPNTLEEAATQFVHTLAEGGFETAHDRLESTAGAMISVGELEQVWMGYEAVGGEFGEIVATEETVEDGVDAVDVTMAFERVEDVLRVYVDDDLEVLGLVLNGEYERPEYADPDAFEEREVTLESDAGPLDGVVTTPAGEREPVPGVVLVHGSGPADKNLESIATRAFEDIATGLATEGVAALRYDKRTFAHRVDPEDHTLEAVTVDDALLAIDELRGLEGVDEDRIVVVGLSMGGMAVPLIAERDGDLAGGVALAAPVRSFPELVSDQLAHQAAVGEHEHEGIVTAAEEWSHQRERLEAGEYDPDDVVSDLPVALWDSLTAYDHVETAREVEVPLYFLQGERDFQVTVEDDLERWRTELEDRPETDFETYEGLNHLFMPGEGPSLPSEYAVRNNVDERVVTDLAEWITDLEEPTARFVSA